MSTSLETIEVKRICSYCKGENSCYAGDKAVVFICKNCNAINQIGFPDNTKKTIPELSDNYLIPIGSKGIIHDIEYIVTGCVLKKEKGTAYTWKEYSLYHPTKGFAFLTVYAGHWTYVYEVPGNPDIKDDVILWKQERYLKYSQYYSQVKKAIGEFPYQINDVYKIQVKEYINPPNLLSSEEDDIYIQYFEGEYITPEEIKKSFNLDKIPIKKGVGALEPYIHKFEPKALKLYCIGLACVWLILQLLFINLAHEEVVLNQNIVVTDSTAGKEIQSTSFELKHGTKNVEIKLDGDVENSWAYAAMTLVNENTGDMYDLDLGVEYYSGYEGGEYWSEGSHDTYKFISSIPEGRYRLIIVPEKPTERAVSIMHISVIRDVYIASNGFILLLLFACFPIYYYYKGTSFERKRWYNSDYSMYDY